MGVSSVVGSEYLEFQRTHANNNPEQEAVWVIFQLSIEDMENKFPWPPLSVTLRKYGKQLCATDT